MAKKIDFFTITRLHRDDLVSMGYKGASRLSDTQMELIATRMGRAYLEGSYWIDLGIIADDLGIKRTKKK